MRHGKGGPGKSGSASAAAAGEGERDYYVHYTSYNRRLDEWVPASRIKGHVRTADEVRAVPALALACGGDWAAARARLCLRSPLARTRTRARTHALARLVPQGGRGRGGGHKRRHDEMEGEGGGGGHGPHAGMDPASAALEREHEEITKVR